MTQGLLFKINGNVVRIAQWRPNLNYCILRSKSDLSTEKTLKMYYAHVPTSHGECNCHILKTCIGKMKERIKTAKYGGT